MQEQLTKQQQIEHLKKEIKKMEEEKERRAEQIRQWKAFNSLVEKHVKSYMDRTGGNQFVQDGKWRPGMGTGFGIETLLERHSKRMLLFWTQWNLHKSAMFQLIIEKS